MPSAHTMSLPEPEILPTPRTRSRWRIIWTAALSFLAATALCIVLAVIIVIVTLLFTGFQGAESFKSLVQSPLFLVCLLVAVELPLAAVGLFLRFIDRNTEFRPQALFETVTLSAIVKGIGAGLALLVFGGLNAYIATKFFGGASTESMEA